MIRFTYQGTDTDQDISPEICSVADAAADLAGWGSGVPIRAIQTSATTWVVTSEGETVTAEVIDE
jgi:hypothetical protein